MNDGLPAAPTALDVPRHRLLLHAPGQPAALLRLPETGDCVIGRDPTCTLCVSHPSVSRRHAVLSPISTGPGKTWLLRDLGSKNGSRLLADAGSGQLAPGDWFAVGDVLACIEAVAPAQWAEQQRRTAQLRATSQVWVTRLAAVPLPAPGQAVAEADDSAASSVDRLLSELLHGVVEVAEASRAFLLLLDADGGWRVRAWHEMTPGRLLEPAFEGSRGALRQVLAQGQAVYFSRRSDPARLAERASVIAGGIEALACLPLHAEGRLLGAVYADSREPGRCFDSLDAELLQALVEQAGAILAAQALQQSLRDLQQRLACEPASAEGSACAQPAFSSAAGAAG